MSDYLSKPVEAETLRRILQSWLQMEQQDLNL